VLEYIQTLPFKGFGLVRLLLLLFEIYDYTVIQQTCIILIKSDSKDFYNVRNQHFRMVYEYSALHHRCKLYFKIY